MVGIQSEYPRYYSFVVKYYIINFVVLGYCELGPVDWIHFIFQSYAHQGVILVDSPVVSVELLVAAHGRTRFTLSRSRRYSVETGYLGRFK